MYRVIIYFIVIVSHFFHQLDSKNKSAQQQQQQVQQQQQQQDGGGPSGMQPMQQDPINALQNLASQGSRPPQIQPQMMMGGQMNMNPNMGPVQPGNNSNVLQSLIHVRCNFVIDVVPINRFFNYLATTWTTTNAKHAKYSTDYATNAW